MYFEALKKRLESRKDIDIEKVEEAYRLAEKAHEHQTRNTGEPYITHPLAVAALVAENKGDEASIIAAILHDVVEDTPTTLKDIEKQFGKEVAILVDGLTKITHDELGHHKKLSLKIESLRKWLDIMQSDIRVAVIKLFDRLHNMQTLEGHKNPEKRLRIAEETLGVYVKIAKNLSMNQVKRALESQSLLYLDPKSYEFYKKVRRRELKEAGAMEDMIEKRLHAADFQDRLLSIRYEAIPPLFIHKHKMQDRDSAEEVIPFIFVITTRTIHDCYYVLYLIHSLWKGKQGTFRDFITSPRTNGGQELRTTVLFDNGLNVDFKIRTREMDEYCQHGVTASCFAKRKTKVHMPWIKQLSYLTNMEVEDSEYFFEKLQNDIMGKTIRIYSRTDEPFFIPAGATMLDIAFYIHGKKALRTKDALMDGYKVTLDTAPKENSIVAFHFSNKKTVQKSWLDITKTVLASSIIHKELKDSSQ